MRFSFQQGMRAGATAKAQNVIDQRRVVPELQQIKRLAGFGQGVPEQNAASSAAMRVSTNGLYRPAAASPARSSQASAR